MTVITEAPSDPFEAWEEQICRTFVTLRARHPEGPVKAFRGGVQAAHFGAVTLSEVTASHAVVERTPRLIHHDDLELYKVGLQVSGTCVIEQDDRQALLRPGDFAIYDTARPYRIAFSDDFRMSVAMFPSSLVQLPRPQLSRLTAVRLPGDTGLGALLSPLIKGLGRDVAASGELVAVHLGDAVVDLVTAALADQLTLSLPEDTSAAHRSLAARVLHFIDAHLHDPQLNSRTIAAAHFVSVRQLQKVFEARGESITTVVRARRLERCRRDLADSLLHEAPIASIGARWGFLDAAHFSRLFRATYGVSPREYRARATSRPLVTGRS